MRALLASSQLLDLISFRWSWWPDPHWFEMGVSCSCSVWGSQIPQRLLPIHGGKNVSTILLSFFSTIAWQSDNDFLTTNGVFQGSPYNGGLDVDNQFLVFRLTLPGAEIPRVWKVGHLQSQIPISTTLNQNFLSFTQKYFPFDYCLFNRSVFPLQWHCKNL